MKTLLSLCFLFAVTTTLQADPKRVYVDVVADLMHGGHINIFKSAKAEGDYLVVGVHSDEDVSTYKRWPIMTMEERIAVVEACRYVDEVIPYAPLKMDEAYIRQHHLDLVIHGDDLSWEKCLESYGEPIRLGIFKRIPYTQGISTTDLINRVVKAYGNP